MPLSIKDAYASWICRRVDNTIKSTWRMIPTVIFWSIWKERNCRCFDGISTPISTIKTRCLVSLYNWHLLSPETVWIIFWILLAP
uniref:Putative ovule protein n=1 Tax=Solanum chacoense TaxID=4108 RepID=A0A0V0HEA6_SOLCH